MAEFMSELMGCYVSYELVGEQAKAYSGNKDVATVNTPQAWAEFWALSLSASAGSRT